MWVFTVWAVGFVSQGTAQLDTRDVIECSMDSAVLLFGSCNKVADSLLAGLSVVWHVCCWVSSSCAWDVLADLVLCVLSRDCGMGMDVRCRVVSIVG
jgi:hypothetical protein